MTREFRCSSCKQHLALGMDTPTFPFCSERCKMSDLGRWMTGDYCISEPLPEIELDSSLDSRLDED